MPPFEIREKPAPEVWLEDSTWVDTRRSRRGDGAPVDPVVITVSTGDEPLDTLLPFYDHAAPDHASPDDAAPERDAVPPAAPAGEVPGLLRRPLVEVQRSVSRGRDVDRPRLQHPDRIALLAVALAIVTLLCAVVTAQG